MKISPKSFTIGIEIEMTGLSRKLAANIIADFFGSESAHVGGKTDLYEILDYQNRVWRIERDDSILPYKISTKGVVRASEEYQVELISPVLYDTDISTVQAMVRILKIYSNAIVNDSTGIHIHIGGRTFTSDNLRTLCNIVYAKQSLLEKSLMWSHRERYCDRLPTDFIINLNETKPKLLSEFADIWYAETLVRDSGRGNYYHQTRYRILNIHQLLSGRQHTVEFRMFNSTLDEDLIKAYINLSTLITAQALNQQRAFYNVRESEVTNDKYLFRIWLLRIGATGDEYKTMRSILLRELEGNSAWRYPDVFMD